MNLKKFFQSLSLTGFVFGFAGWFYIAQNAVNHPETLPLPLTHFGGPREDTFGAICFAVSLVSFFIYNLIRDPRPKR